MTDRRDICIITGSSMAFAVNYNVKNIKSVLNGNTSKII